MRLHGRGVDQDLGGRTAGLSERMKQVHPHPLGGPAHKAIVEGLVRPIDGRRIPPAQAVAQNMKDAAQHPPIIHPGLAPSLRKVRPEPLHLLLRQPELSAHAAPPKVGERESANRLKSQRLCRS